MFQKVSIRWTSGIAASSQPKQRFQRVLQIGKVKKIQMQPPDAVAHQNALYRIKFSSAILEILLMRIKCVEVKFRKKALCFNLV